MKIKSFGCSFIFGNDLADDDRDYPYDTASQYTWPALLSRDLGYEYQCFARPGAGNLRIADRVLTHAVDTGPTLFVIGWSWIDRFDWTTHQPQTFDRVLPSDPEEWRTVMPVDTDARAKFYYRDLHSQYRDKLTSLLAIKTCIDTLNQKGHQFLMTYIDQLMFETTWHATPTVLDLQQYIKPYMTSFEDKTFLEWSRARGFKISPSWHPLEEAHQAGFELIKSYNLV